MKKMKLSLDDLKVESFQTTPGQEENQDGTVYGYITCDLTLCQGCGDPTCPCTQDVSCNGTCAQSCNGTCVQSCNGTCDASCGGGCGGLTCPEICGTFACFYCTRRDC